jgi:hypothetical protein
MTPCPGTIDWACTKPAGHAGAHAPGALRAGSGPVPSWAELREQIEHWQDEGGEG